MFTTEVSNEILNKFIRPLLENPIVAEFHANISRTVVGTGVYLKLEDNKVTPNVFMSLD